MEKIKILLPERMAGQRLDLSLAQMLPDCSRSKITLWIKSGDALINNKPFKPKDSAKGKEVVTLLKNHKEKINWIPEKIPLNIVFEDEEILNIRKNIDFFSIIFS